jgi:hypothetical protein
MYCQLKFQRSTAAWIVDGFLLFILFAVAPIAAIIGYAALIGTQAWIVGFSDRGTL